MPTHIQILAITSLAACLAALSGAEPDRSTSMPLTVTVQTEAGHDISARLYLPIDFTGDSQIPGVVITGAWTSVQDQMPATYARALADRGLAALTFDFSGWGASVGKPRFMEDPERKIDDIKLAADALAARPEVDATRIAGLGICASAGYMAEVAASHPDLRCLALVAPWLHDQSIVEAVYGGADGVASLIETGRSAAASTTPRIIEAASTTNQNALMYQAPYYTEPDRGLIPTYDNKFNLASWEPWLRFDALAIAPRIHHPTLLVHSQAAAIPQGAEMFSNQMGVLAEMVWLDGISQFDFYDQTDAVTVAADHVAEHITATFAQRADVSRIKGTITAMATMVDRHMFTELETLYAETVTIDYRDLGSPDIITISATDLMRDWADMLPGFDQTLHQLGPIHVRIGEQGTAQAEVDIVAGHHMQAAYWEVRGQYEIGLIADGDQWRISSQTIHVNGETGSRGIIAEARANAAEQRDANAITTP